MGARSHRPAAEDTAEVQALTDSERAAQRAVMERAEVVKARLRALKRSLSPAGGLPAVQRPKPGPASPVPPAPAEAAIVRPGDESEGERRDDGTDAVRPSSDHERLAGT